MATYKSIKYNISGADLTAIPTSAITSGTFADARISESSVTQHAATFDDNKIQSNIALLGFKAAANGSLAKYNLQDQIIDEYEDETGIDAGASTNEGLTSGSYGGRTLSSSGSNDWSYTGSNQAWTSPAGVTEITVKAWGAGGGGGQSGYGGGGGYATSTFTITPETVFAAVVGQGGQGNQSGAPTTSQAYGGGGANNGSSQTNYGGGTGGGYSGLFVTSTVNQTQAIIVAGAGGGGCGMGGLTSGGGGGGGENGGDGGSGNRGGDGGTQSAGGAVGSDSSETVQATVGTALQGGTGGSSHEPYRGAGGGGGWYGGGGGQATSGAAGGSGGGGSGYVRSSSFPTGVSASASTTLTAATGMTTPTEANSSDSDSSGAGGTSSSSTGTDGENGFMTVDWSIYTDGGDLTLQSTDTTASTEADNADMVMLMENGAGTATLNTDIKGYISRDSGTTFTQGTLVDEGTWGTNKKILAFHDLDISGQPSGTSMCYKITTHNQSAGSKETKIHATSIGWKE